MKNIKIIIFIPLVLFALIGCTPDPKSYNKPSETSSTILDSSTEEIKSDDISDSSISSASISSSEMSISSKVFNEEEDSASNISWGSIIIYS